MILGQNALRRLSIQHQQASIQRQQVRRIASAAAALAGAVGYILADGIANYDSAALAACARSAAAAACVIVALGIAEARVHRLLSRIEGQQRALEQLMEGRLERAEYAEGYVDGLQRRPPRDEGDGPHLRAV